jgi:hypothetical protein
VLSVSEPGFWQQQQSGRGAIFAEGWRQYCVYVRGPRDTEPQASESGPAYDIITISDGPEYDDSNDNMCSSKRRNDIL